jgi:predicted GNAT family N-acyltransferase
MIIFGVMNPEDIRIVHAEEDADFDQIFRIREVVFEQEMGVPEEAQIDGFDPVAHHYIIMWKDHTVGVGRWRVTLGGNIRLERLAVLPSYRRQGLGRTLMEKMLGDVPRNRPVYIECPRTQAGYFAGFGFLVEGEEFDFQGIPHVRMELRK